MNLLYGPKEHPPFPPLVTEGGKEDVVIWSLATWTGRRISIRMHA
jgi:hypothetical protein